MLKCMKRNTIYKVNSFSIYRILKAKKTMLGGVLGATLARKMTRMLSWPIWDRRGMPKMAARWPNLGPRRSVDGAKLPKVGVWPS